MTGNPAAGHEPGGDVMGGPEPDEQRTDVMGGREPGGDVMSGQEAGQQQAGGHEPDDESG